MGCLPKNPLAVIRSISDTSELRAGARRRAGARLALWRCAGRSSAGPAPAASTRWSSPRPARSAPASTARSRSSSARSSATARRSTCAARSSTTCTSCATSSPRAPSSSRSSTRCRPGAVVVLAAHGVAPVIRAQAAERSDLKVIDATCPLVAKVHTEARRYASQDYDLVLIGHPDHEEVIGTLGEAPDRFHVVESVPRTSTRLRLTAGRTARVVYLTQTTLATDETAEIVAALRRRFPEIAGAAGRRHLLRHPEPPGRRAPDRPSLRPHARRGLGQLVQHRPPRRGGPARRAAAPS